MILETNKGEGEEFLLTSYPQNMEYMRWLTSMKGIFLACNGVSKTLLGEDTDVFMFKLGDKSEEGFIGNMRVRSKQGLD